MGWNMGQWDVYKHGVIYGVTWAKQLHVSFGKVWGKRWGADGNKNMGQNMGQDFTLIMG